MSEPTRKADFLLEQCATTLAAKGRLEAHSGEAQRRPDRRDSTDRRLELVRSYINEAIERCVRRESRGDIVESDDRWRVAPRHLTEIDSLNRLSRHFDRLAKRFQGTVAHERPHGTAKPMHKVDLALAESAAAMVRRFEVVDGRHDLLADLEADFSKFESLLDERALLSSSEN